MTNTCWINKYKNLDTEWELSTLDICCYAMGFIGGVYVLAIMLMQ